MSLSNRARISKFLGPKGQKQIAQARAAVALASAKPRPTVRSLDKRIKKINRQTELKHIDTFNSATVISSTATIIPLNLSVQGDTDITRTGDDIQATSIQWRMVFISDADRLSGTIIRFLLVWDRQANGVAATAAQVLDTSVITNPTLAPYNHSFQQRFKILHDSIILQNPNVLLDFDPASGNSTTDQPLINHMKNKRQLSRTVKYNGNAGTIADIETNSLLAIFVSNAAADGPALTSGFRFYFKDL